MERGILTGQEIVQERILNNFCTNAIQQQGIDVRIDSVFELISDGTVPKDKKTDLPAMKKIEPFDNNVFVLAPGYYCIDLMEGCNIPNNRALWFKTRSSLVRCGAIVHSGQFDAGFRTDNMGCYLQVNRPIKIEKGARIAQAVVFCSSDVENTYNGQFQNDKQRN